MCLCGNEFSVLVICFDLNKCTDVFSLASHVVSLRDFKFFQEHLEQL